MNTGWPDSNNKNLERAVRNVWTFFFLALALFFIPPAIPVMPASYCESIDYLFSVVCFDLVVLRILLSRLYAVSVELPGSELIKFRSHSRDYRKLQLRHVLGFHRCVNEQGDFILSYVASRAGIGMLLLRELQEQEVEHLSRLGIKIETHRLAWAKWLLPDRAFWFALFAMLVIASLYVAVSVINVGSIENSLSWLSVHTLGIFLTLFGIANVLGADVFAFLKLETDVPRFVSRLLGFFEGGLELVLGLSLLGGLF